MITKEEKAAFRARCESATDAVLRALLVKEQLARRGALVDIARSVLKERGIA